MTQTPDGAGNQYPQKGYGGAMMPRSAYEIGKVRSTGVCILLAIVTLGIYTWVWYYSVHAEMKRHRQAGLGGGVALILAILVPFVLAFLTPAETGNMYEARGQRPPVTGVTGCWIFLPFVGGLIWFIKRMVRSTTTGGRSAQPEPGAGRHTNRTRRPRGSHIPRYAGTWAQVAPLDSCWCEAAPGAS